MFLVFTVLRIEPAKNRNFILYCPGKTHRSDGACPNHPWFSLKGGLEVR